MTVDEGGVAKLANQDDGAALRLIEQYGRPIATVVGLTGLALPTAVTAQEREGGLF
ncbi:hypothetical protein D3C85_1721500 [compost metagenome]